MKPVTRITTIAGAVLATAVVASSVVGTHLADNSHQQGRAHLDTGHPRLCRREEDRLPDRQDDDQGEARAGPAALRRPDHRRRGQGRRRWCLLAHRPQADQPLPAPRGGAVAAAHPDPVRLRHDPRLPHDLPGAAGRGELLRPRRGATDASIGARESATVGIKQIYSPMVDVSHEPRWGRIVEGNGEDPYLGSEMAAARVQRRPGHDYAAKNKTVTSVKHFVGYGAAGGRPRLQHHRHVRVDAAQPLPAPVQGRGRCRRPTR